MKQNEQRAVDQRPPFSRRKKVVFSLFLFSFFLVTFLLLAEVVLRYQAFRPWVISGNMIVEPEGKLIRPDPELGYLFRPGESKITIPGPYTFKMTHLSSGFRITHPLSTYAEAMKPEIWIFGCSFTHGWSLNDEQTYPWVLQEQLPGYEILNYGIVGGSTVQSLIQFRKALKAGKRPAVVVLTYASMHDTRNAVTRAWLKLRMTGSRGYVPGSISLPYMKWSADNAPELLYRPLDYHGVPLLRYSAAANYLDDKLNAYLESSYHGHEISRAIIEEFVNLCNANGIKLVVAGIVSDPSTAEMLDYWQKRGIMTVDISVDLGIRENTNQPYDRHPSAIANQQYAQKLKAFLCGAVIRDSCVK